MEAHQKALDKAKIDLMSKPGSVFFSSLCLSVVHGWDASAPTAYTDGRNIRYNPEYFMGLSRNERVGLLIHETMHIAYMHSSRKGSKDHKQWNYACDYVINLQITKAGFSLPKGGLLDTKYTGLSAEQVYELLEEAPEYHPDDLMDISEKGDSEDVPEDLEQEMQDALVRAVMQAQQHETSKSNIPGEVIVFLNKLQNPKLPWQRILSRFLNQVAKTDYTWKRPNRRAPEGTYIPSLHNETLRDVVIAWDMSGSITDQETTRFASECAGILKYMKPEKLTLIQFDTEIISVDKLKTVKDIAKLNMQGRGGTCIIPVLDWVNKHKPQVILIFTDGYFDIPKYTAKSQIIWLIHNNEGFSPKYGKVIEYKV